MFALHFVTLHLFVVHWCDKILNESLPGDGFGRGCFDTLPRFVGDPSARFETHTPLTYETNGETGQPLWKEIFGHILKECAYLTAFQTVYVMVDTRNLKAHETSQDGLPHWPAAVAWWHWDPTKRERSCSFFQLLKRDWPTSGASHLGRYICPCCVGGCLSGYQLYLAGQ